MFQNKGQSVSPFEEDGRIMDELRAKAVEAESKMQHLQEENQTKDTMIRQLKQVYNDYFVSRT